MGIQINRRNVLGLTSGDLSAEFASGHSGFVCAVISKPDLKVAGAAAPLSDPAQTPHRRNIQHSPTTQVLNMAPSHQAIIKVDTLGLSSAIFDVPKDDFRLVL